jgi:uncharacterized protein (DUF2147 family)
MPQAPRFPAKTRGLCVAAVGFAVVLGSGVAYADPIAPDGIWYDKDQSTIIKMHPCADPAATSFCGTIVWLKDAKEADGTPAVDKNNKDPAKKTQPMIGLDIFTKMVADDDHWKGKVYNPDDGKVYDVTFTVKTDKEPNDQADVRGCLLGFLCRTETFTRAAEVPGGDPTADATTATNPTAVKKKKLKKDSAKK